MANIVEWVNSLEPWQKKKPPKPLQQEAAEKIIEALNSGECNYADAINAFVAFATPMLESFYARYYWDMPEKMRTKWDHAFYHWAENKKPVSQAFSRMVLVVKAKLQKVESVAEIEQEIRWVAIHIDEKNASYLSPLSASTKFVDLKKLLDLDLNEWKFGKAQTEKLIEGIFASREDRQAKALYADFLARHGKLEQVSESDQVITEEKQVQSETAPAAPEEKPCDLPTPVIQAEKPQEEPQPVVPEKKQVEEPSTMEIPADGVVLAEALLKWAQEQKTKAVTQTSAIMDLNAQKQKTAAQIDALTQQVAELQSKINHLAEEKAQLIQQLQEANAMNVVLEQEKAQAEDTIGHVQQMSGNSVKQELDGFKAKLASALTNDVKDFRQEYSDEEKAEVYAAFLEDMIDILKSNGIAVEE